MKGIHENFDRDEIRQGSDRSFGFVFATVFALVALSLPLFGRAPRLWALAPAAAFLAAALVAPRLLSPLNRWWFRFGVLLHRFVTPIVMGAIFFGAVLPTALIMRLRGRDPLRLVARAARRTNWIVRAPGPTPESMKHLF